MIRLRDEQWDRIRKHFPEEHVPDGRPGRKPIPTRRVLEAVLWILNTGAQWHMLPQSYPNYKTMHRRFQTWLLEDRNAGLLHSHLGSLREFLVVCYPLWLFGVCMANVGDGMFDLVIWWLPGHRTRR